MEGLKWTLESPSGEILTEGVISAEADPDTTALEAADRFLRKAKGPYDGAFFQLFKGLRGGVPRLNLLLEDYTVEGSVFRLWQNYKEGYRAKDYKIVTLLPKAILCRSYDHLTCNEWYELLYVREGGGVHLPQDHYYTYEDMCRARHDSEGEKISTLQRQIESLRRDLKEWDSKTFVGMPYPFED